MPVLKVAGKILVLAVECYVADKLAGYIEKKLNQPKKLKNRGNEKWK